MAHVINSDCVSCGSCASECPVEAISPGPQQYIIDPKKCIDCGRCVDVCPVNAIAPGN